MSAEQAVAPETETPENGTDAEKVVVADEAAVPAEGATDAAEAPKEEVKKHPTGRTVIVRNIPPSMLFTYQDELRNLFSKYGNIGYIKLGGITVDQSTVEPTLTAFMNFADPESSDKAMEGNGTEMGGNALQLQVLRSGKHTAVVSNIPATISEESLRQIFSPCGEIKKIVKIPARPTAFVEFEEEEGLTKALSLCGQLSMNNMDVFIFKQGAESKPKIESKNKMRKAKLAKARTAAAALRAGGAAAEVPRVVGAPTPRGGGAAGPIRGRGNAAGAARGRGAPRGSHGPGNWVNNQPNWGGQYNNQWDGDYGRNNYGGGGNNWGNGNNYPSNNESQRGFKRRKQNDWIWQY